MNRSDIEKIIAIAEAGSMAKAAQKLYITQPALSKCLSKVEESLGESLFIRRPNGLSLTYAGECFLQRAYQILKLYDCVDMEFCELNHMRKGILKLGAAERLGALVLPHLLKTFNQRYPNIQIDIVEENSGILEDKLLLGGLDIAILCLPLKNDNIHYKVFYEEPLYIALPKEHRLNTYAYRKEGEKMPYLDLQLLKGENFILTKAYKKTRIAADNILKYLGGDYNITLESQNIETVIRLVANGLGIALIPHLFSKIYSTGDKINYYCIDESYESIWQWAVIHSESINNLSRPSRELYNILCEEGCRLPNYLDIVE